MLKLFYNKFSRASRIRWALEEMNAPYEIVPMTRTETGFEYPEYQNIHPLELIPAITDGEYKLFETGAICLYLTDKFGKLAPPVSNLEARGKYYQWMFFAMTELDPNAAQIFVHTKRYDETRKNTVLLDDARKAFDKRAKLLSNHLTDHAFMLGQEFSAVDVMIGSVLQWAKSMELLTDYPVLNTYCDKLQSRPALQRAQAN